MPSPILATRLRAEYLDKPLNLPTATPRFFWWVQDERPGARQTGYRVRVASSVDRLASPDLWDSGKVESDAQAHVLYAGKALTSRSAAVWDVTLFDADGVAGEPSAPSSFEVGLLSNADWSAQWITTPIVGTSNASPPVPWLRKSFNLNKPVRSARLYITALGIYQAHLNGQRVGDDYFRPGWTEYTKRVQHQAYDVTSLLKTGENAIGALLGDGWYVGRVAWHERGIAWGDRPALMAQLEVTHDDGSVTRLVTDESWQWKRSAILGSDMLAGEEYDARLEDPNWCLVPLSKADWNPVVPFTPRDPIVIVPQPNEPVRVTEEIKPAGDPTRRGVSGDRDAFQFDLGQNFAGIVRLKIKGPRGATVRIRYAEMLNKDGSLYTDNYRSARVTDFYTLRGDPNGETFTPVFTFHGFRYVSVEILRWHLNEKHGQTVELPTRDSIVGLVLQSDTPRTGDFSCSHELLNRLQQNISWGQRSNFLEAPTDCPQRDERLGWTGDAQVFVSTAAFNMDVAAFFTKWVQDCDDAQTADGQLPMVVPAITGMREQDGSAGWSDARVVCPWAMYLAYGDKALLEKHYPAMKRWIDWENATARDGVRSYADFKQHKGFGDWLALDHPEKSNFGGTPLDLIGTAYFARSAGNMAEIATVLGKADDAAQFSQMRATAVSAFQKNFVKPDGTATADTQTAHLMALGFDLLPESQRPAALDRLLKLLEDRDWHLSTGFLGTPLLLPVLTRFGKLDVAYKILSQTTYPGWLYTVSIGATTMWERWNSWTPETGFGDVGMNSFNHYAYGAVGRCIYDTLGGLALDPTKPAYKHALIAPRPGAGITHACTSIESLHGRYEVRWALDADRFSLEAIVPANATATITLPDGTSRDVVAGTHKLTATVKT